jgi:SAM-dependent methyltransferase
MSASPLEVFDAALSAPRGRLALALADGAQQPLPLARWHGRATAADLLVLEQARGPVLDVGCGPGRHLEALAARGVPALGLDISATAVRLARRRGVRAVRGSVWGVLPGPRTWGTVLLLDGTLGLDGRPRALLRRASGLLAPGGCVLVEVDAGGAPGPVRLVGADGPSAPFEWAAVGWGDLDALAASAGYAVGWRRRCGERGFARLEAAAAGRSASSTRSPTTAAARRISPAGSPPR